MPPGQESLVIIVDYKSCSLRTNPSISVARQVSTASMSYPWQTLMAPQTLTILQQHYVETLGRALVVNLPMILNFFYKGISPFLDPVTRDKVRVIILGLRKLIQLWAFVDAVQPRFDRAHTKRTTRRSVWRRFRIRI